MTQLSLSGVGADFGASAVLSDVTLTVAAGDRWGLVGRNGSGKTTLFRLLTGELQPSRGMIARQPGLRVSLLEQHRDFGSAVTVWEAAAGELADLLALERSLTAQAAALGEGATPEALERYGRDLERFEHEGGYTVTARIDAVLQGLGFDPAAARTTPVEALSGGERGRVGLARQLAGNADVLLLDEPTNHLDLETTRWLEIFLRETPRTVLLISHDRALLAAVADHILHFEAGTAVPYAAGYEVFVRQRAERRLAEQRAYEEQQRRIAREREFIARNIAGQNSRQARGRRTRLARLPRLSAPLDEEAAMALRFEAGSRGGDVVAELCDVALEAGGRILIEHVTATLRRGDVVGLVGPNGAGKTTLLRALLGEHPVGAGTLRLGASIVAGFYRQDLSDVPLGKSVYDSIADLRPHWERRLVQRHLGRFGFSGDEVQRRTGSLSGGERARVALAMLMLSRANLLVLDEPTNHLDVESIEALEDALLAYDGSILLVSHDRELLRSVTTRVWALQDRRVTVFDGGYAEWEEAREAPARAAARAADDEARPRGQARRRTGGAAAVSDRTGAVHKRRLVEAHRELAEAETLVQDLEARIASLTTALEDPAMYTRPEGVALAHQHGATLNALRQELEGALARWAAAGERAEALARAAE